MRTDAAKWKRAVALGAWAALIFVTSCYHVTVRQFLRFMRHAGPPAFQAAFSRFWDGYWWVFVKGWHAIEFAVLMLLCTAVLRRWVPRRDRAVLAALAITALFAASDEWHQTFVPGRGGHLSDVCIDIGGACVAGLIILTRPRHGPC